MSVYQDEERQLIFHITFKDNYEKGLKTLCSTIHPVKYIANFHTISTRMIGCSQRHACSDINTKNRSPLRGKVIH